MRRITPINDKKADEGVDLMYHGVSLKIRRANNTKFVQAFKYYSKPHQRDIDKDVLDEETQKDILVSAMADGLLVGWSNYTDDNGDEIPYSKKEAKMLLSDDPDCRQFVLDEAARLSNFIDETKKATAKKSATIIDGTQKMATK